MRKLIIDELDNSLGFLWESNCEFSYHVGKAAGVAAATGEPGLFFEWLCDDISNAYELVDFAAGYSDDFDDFDPEQFEHVGEYIDNREMNFKYIIKVLEESAEDASTDEANAAPDIEWEECGVALHEAMVSREAGDYVRYALMIGFVSGLMFQEPGPSYKSGTILDAIVEGYEDDKVDRLEWAQARLRAAHRLTDPSPFMKKAAYDSYMEGKLRTMRWVQNFGLQAARGGDDRVVIPMSMSINHALKNMKRNNE